MRLALEHEVTVVDNEEAEILKMVSEGKPNHEIASILGYSRSTLKYRLRTLYRKLEAKNQANAVSIAIENGLISRG